MTRIMTSTTCSIVLCTRHSIASCRMMQHAQYATLICDVYDTHICHGASQSAYCCKSNTCSIFVMVTLCDASDGVLRDHARGTWDVLPSVTISQHATLEHKACAHGATQAGVGTLPMLMWHGARQTELPVVELSQGGPVVCVASMLPCTRHGAQARGQVLRKRVCYSGAWGYGAHIGACGAL